MKKSKRTNASRRKNKVDDMISKLPDPLLHLILSRLPTTEQVIRTSILSKRWRHLWTSIPCIDIDCSRGVKPQKEFETNKFAEFVYWILANKSLDFDSFRLCCSNYYSMSTVGRWIHIAVMKKVKVIDLMFCPKEESQDIELPYCLVTCSSLEVLRLFLFHRRLSLPNFTGFSQLRVLELNSVELFDAGLVQHFLESCPLLQELSFIHCMLFKVGYLCFSSPNLNKLTIDNLNIFGGYLWNGIKISCPKLGVLEFAGHIANTFSFESLDSFKKAVIRPEDLDELDIGYDPRGDTVRNLFAQICHAEFLSLSHYFIKELDVQAVSLPNLKTLELTTTLDAAIMDGLIKLLICLPHLESLHLIIQKEYFTDKHWKLGKAETRRILAPRLKRVEFLDCNGEYSKLVMVRSLLKHGNALEEMAFNWDKYYQDRSMETMKKVSKYRKASSTIKLITLLKD